MHLTRLINNTSKLRNLDYSQHKNLNLFFLKFMKPSKISLVKLQLKSDKVELMVKSSP